MYIYICICLVYAYVYESATTTKRRLVYFIVVEFQAPENIECFAIGVYRTFEKWIVKLKMDTFCQKRNVTKAWVLNTKVPQQPKDV
jgi:hypothetical protein